MAVVPRLIIDQSVRDPLASSDSRAPGTQVWRDLDGVVSALCLRRDGQRSIEFPGIARFFVRDDRSCVTAVPHADCRLDEVVDTYRRAAVPVLLQALGTEVLHASAVHTAHGVIGLCAVARTGKSTIAFALARRGYRIWADDALAVELSSDPVRTIPLPFEVRLRPSAAAYFDSRGFAPEPPTARPASDDGAQPLSALVVLRRRSGAPLTLRQIPPARAFAALLPHAYCFSLQELDDKRRIIERYLDLARRVPVYEIEFQPDFESLPAVLDALERLATRPS